MRCQDRRSASGLQAAPFNRPSPAPGSAKARIRPGTGGCLYAESPGLVSQDREPPNRFRCRGIRCQATGRTMPGERFLDSFRTNRSGCPRRVFLLSRVTGRTCLYPHSADSMDNIAFIHLVQDSWRGSPNTTYLESQADTAVGSVRLKTVDNLEGIPALCYLVEVDGLTIYYQAFATDNLNRLDQDWNGLVASTDTVHIAFLPIPKPDSDGESDISLFLRRFPTRFVCLVDAGRRSDKHCH